MISKLVLVLPVLVALVGCSAPLNGPLYDTGDVVLVKLSGANPTPADAPTALIVRRWSVDGLSGGWWEYEIAFPGYVRTAMEHDLTKIGHFNWSKLREMCDEPVVPAKPPKMPVVPAPNLTERKT